MEEDVLKDLRGHLQHIEYNLNAINVLVEMEAGVHTSGSCFKKQHKKCTYVHCQCKCHEEME